MQGHAECLESAGTEKAILPSGSQNVAGFPVWHVVPQLLERSTLHALLDELLPFHPPQSQCLHLGMDNRKCLGTSRPCEIGESVSQTGDGR